MTLHRVFGVIGITLLLSACNGQAPLLTCTNPCAHGDEYRNLFCECIKNTPTSPSAGGGVLTPPGTPFFDWDWKEAYGCNLNRYYYLLNYNPKKLIVKVSKRIPGTIERSETEYTVQGNATKRDQGVAIGFEEITYNDDCFDQDFMISGWREPQHNSSRDFAMSRLMESRAALISRQTNTIQRIEIGGEIKALSVQEAPRAKMTIMSKPAVTTTYREVKPADCVQVCDSEDTLNCPIRGYPPDQKLLVALRDRIRGNPSSGDYNTSDIYTLFGISKVSCDRSDAKVVAKKVLNRGDYCSFPVYLRETDKEPSIAIHFPTSIKGTRLARANASSGLAFSYGTSNPLLLFSDEDLNSDFGGSVTEVLASEKGIYYQTSATCIFLGAK